jgi:two-component system CheB/CheR fusion protein
MVSSSIDGPELGRARDYFKNRARGSGRAGRAVKRRVSSATRNPSEYVAGVTALMQNFDTLAPGTRPPGSTRTFLGAGLVLLAVVAYGWVVLSNTQTLVEQTRWVQHTWQVIGESEAALSMVKDAEAGQRGYLLTKDRAYLVPYDAALAGIRGHLVRLHELVGDNAPQQARVAEFTDLVNSKLNELGDTIQLFSSGDEAAALRTVQTGLGRQTMERIRAAMEGIRSEENRLLAERTLLARSAATSVRAAALLGGAAFVALVAAFLGAVRSDLLGRARAEATARESEQRLRTTLHSIGDAVLATDANGIVILMNPVAERMTGWPASDAVGRPVEEVFRILNERSRNTVESPVRRVLREGVVVGLANHTALVARDGTERPIADSGAPVRDARGTVIGVVLVFRDVTKQQLAERDVQRLAAIVSSANHAIIGETVQNVITDWNPGAEALFGYTAAEMIGRKMASLAPLDAVDPTPALTAELIAGRRVAEFDARRRTKSGQWIDVVVTLSPIRDEDGNVVGISRLLRDVTERRRQGRELEEARQRAEEASEAKDRFLATLSHELRTPLTPVMASLHRLERRPDLGPGMAESLAMIHRNVELEARLIDDLLDLTRISRGKIELERLPLDLHAVLANVVQSSRSEFINKGLQVTMRLDAGERYCEGDAARLQQVFWNLLKNAAKFTPAGGSVTVRSENPGPGRLRVSVADTGKGIRADLLPRIFEAFEQGDVTATRRAGGLGLGLAIARNLVELHGGSISVASGGEGLGATFTVDLATTAARPVTVPLPIRGGTEEDDARRRTSVLLVEDDVDTGEAMKMLLDEAGFDVRAAGSVEEANRLFRERPADVLVTDVGLPDGSGLDLLGALKAVHPGLRAVVLSGYGMEEDIQRSRKLGFAEHFVKPINPSRLIATLDLLGSRERSRS